MDSVIQFADLCLNPVQHIQTLGMLTGIVLIQFVKPPHQRTANNGYDNGNPPVHARLHPSTSNRLRIIAVNPGVTDCLLLTFLYRGSMKLFLPVGKT